MSLLRRERRTHKKFVVSDDSVVIGECFCLRDQSRTAIFVQLKLITLLLAFSSKKNEN